MDDWNANNENFPNWRVEYLSGSDWRVTIFRFIIDHTVKEPVVKFISEDPHLTYVSIKSPINFGVS